MVHVAGGVFEGGFYFDTHAHPVPDAVFDLVARVLATVGDVPLILERDSNFPNFAEIDGELSRLVALPRPLAAAARASQAPRVTPEPSAGQTPTMMEAQRRMAALLTAPLVPSEPTLARARDILQKKRADDALPLLPTFAAQGNDALAFAVRSLERLSRPPALVAVSDALSIAAAAEEDVALRAAAREDALMLRARFIVDDGIVRPRVGPFLERARSAGGGARWVMKGLGGSAKVRVIERRG
jgi:hypothetical protein